MSPHGGSTTKSIPLPGQVASHAGMDNQIEKEVRPRRALGIHPSKGTLAAGMPSTISSGSRMRVELILGTTMFSMEQTDSTLVKAFDPVMAQHGCCKAFIGYL